jgi:hypothetical protein
VNFKNMDQLRSTLKLLVWMKLKKKPMYNIITINYSNNNNNNNNNTNYNITVLIIIVYLLPTYYIRHVSLCSVNVTIVTARTSVHLIKSSQMAILLYLM